MEVYVVRRRRALEQFPRGKRQRMSIQKDKSDELADEKRKLGNWSQ